MEWLAVGSPYPARGWLYHGQDRQEVFDANAECKCGRLAGDSTSPCGCWASEILIDVLELVPA